MGRICLAGEVNQNVVSTLLYVAPVPLYYWAQYTLHTKWNFTSGDSFCWPTLLECISRIPWRWTLKWKHSDVRYSVNNVVISENIIVSVGIYSI